MNKHPLDVGLEVTIPSLFYSPALHSLVTLACALSVLSCPMNHDFFSKSAFATLTVSSSTLEMSWWCMGSTKTAKQDCSALSRRFQNYFTHGNRSQSASSPTLDMQALFSELRLDSEMDFVGPTCHPEQRHCSGIIQDNNYISTQALSLQNNSSKNITSIGRVTCIHEVAWKITWGLNNVLLCLPSPGLFLALSKAWSKIPPLPSLKRKHFQLGFKDVHCK